jgi:hypothetical protein
MRITLALIIFGMVVSARAETTMHATAHTDGSVYVWLHDDDTGRTMDTTLTPARTKQFITYLAKHNIVADKNTNATPAPETKPGCGIGDFFGGRC